MFGFKHELSCQQVHLHLVADMLKMMTMVLMMITMMMMMTMEMMVMMVMMMALSHVEMSSTNP